MPGDPKPYLGLVVEEYKILRDESKQASINMWTAMQWGSAIIGVVIAVGLSQWGRAYPTTVLALGLLVPLFSAMTMIFWLGEAARFKRVGDYIVLLERKMSVVLREAGDVPVAVVDGWPDLQRQAEAALHLRASPAPEEGELVLSDPLAWEQWLRHRAGRSVAEGHLRVLYMLRLGFFLILPVGSLAVAAFYMFEDIGYPSDEPFNWVILGLGALITAAAAFGAKDVGGRLAEKADPLPGITSRNASSNASSATNTR
jgi:hypothetical protein